MDGGSIRYRKTLLAVLLSLLGVALFVTPRAPTRPNPTAARRLPTGCVAIPPTLGKKYHLEFGLLGTPPETAPVVAVTR